MAEHDVGQPAAGRRSGTTVPEPDDVPFENEALIGGPPAGPEGHGTVSGGPVLDHVAAFARAVADATGATAISTYDGHHPDRTCALDILVSSAYGSVPDDSSVGDSVAAFTLDHWSDYGVSYVIWNQRINSDDSRGWRPMADRGSITQNHLDHNHVSFAETAAGGGGDSRGGGGGGGGGFPKRGSQGEGVRQIQARLIELGWNLSADGDFGPLTEAAVIEFQARHGLDQDGVVGPRTAAALGLD